MDRFYAYALSALVLSLVGWPALRSPSEDGFPLSTYPMFARPRERVNDVTGAIAVSADGERSPIPPRFVANGEAMQAVATLRKTIAAGPDAARELCQVIASRLRDSARMARSSDAADTPLREARRVEIVTGRVDAIDYLAGRATPRTRRLHARCDVHGEVP